MYNWRNVEDIGSKSYKCKFCDREIATRHGYQKQNSNCCVYICSHCGKPTFFEGNKQIPSPQLGNSVSNVPENIYKLYNEIRDCTAVNAFTSAVLSCRKLLMNIAVEQDANEGQKFIEYVNYLAKKGFVPPNGIEWVDHIRKKGNEANHEIVFMTSEDAMDLINFIEMLLKFIYEFPGRLKKEEPENQPSNNSIEQT